MITTYFKIWLNTRLSCYSRPQNGLNYESYFVVEMLTKMDLKEEDDDIYSDPWFERFEFIQPLGSGGMGEVYLVEDKDNNSAPCVIKKIFNNKRGDLQAQADMLRMGQREAEFLHKLNHRGIVKYLDDHYSENENGYYVVMEYIEGRNLEEVVQRETTLNSDTVLRIAIQCCDVLEYLHSAEPAIIYRDLKPSNLMLKPDGLVVFIDFGIARDTPKDGPATRVVTSGYSPPEQYFGKPEPCGDLYSLGATMHHLLTGVRPKPLTPCTPRKYNSDVLPDLDALITALTAQDKNDRPPSARAVQFELFRIYQQLHPEFEIPDLAMDAEAEYEAEIDKIHKRSRRQFDEADDSDEYDDTASGGAPKLVDKFKNWFGNLGKRAD